MAANHRVTFVGGSPARINETLLQELDTRDDIVSVQESKGGFLVFTQGPPRPAAEGPSSSSSSKKAK